MSIVSICCLYTPYSCIDTVRQSPTKNVSWGCTVYCEKFKKLSCEPIKSCTWMTKKTQPHFKTRSLLARVMSNVSEGFSDIEKVKDNKGRPRLSRVRRAKETSQETQKRFKAQRQRDANRVQCESAEHRAHRLHVQNELKHPICFRCKSLLLTNIP